MKSSIKSAAVLALVMAACAERGTPVSMAPDARHSTSTQDASTSGPVSRLEDPSSRLTQDARTKLIAQLQKLANTHGSNVGILVVPSTNGDNIDTVAQKTFADWQLGEKGILVVLAMQEHRSRIETGSGIEKMLTDDRCGQILRDLRPHLQQGEVYEALHEGLEAIGSALQGGDTGTKRQRVGRTFTNGNCAIDSNRKLTGLCVASDRTGTKCIAQQPDPSSEPCMLGTIVTETRTPTCAGGQSADRVSRQHVCSFVEEP